jgi:hypothetical protein
MLKQIAGMVIVVEPVNAALRAEIPPRSLCDETAAVSTTADWKLGDLDGRSKGEMLGT